jgi:dTDP-4-dehydrorhamnose reductase
MPHMGPILVAGRSGQLANCLAGLARSRETPLVCRGRPELDLDNAASITRAVTAVLPRAIVNAAGYTAVDKAESEPDLAYAINRDGAARLARAAREFGVPFVHVSTDYVFDGRKGSPYREDDPAAPLGVYGRSKLEGEQAVAAANPAALILRASWVYSCYGQNFVRTMLRMAQTRDVVRVVDDQRGSPTSAADIADAILTLLERFSSAANAHRAGVYHLTGAGEATWYSFAAAIFSLWGGRGHRVPMLEPITTAEFPTPARRPADSRLDCGKIRMMFGIALPPWRRSLELCLDQLAAAPIELKER